MSNGADMLLSLKITIIKVLSSVFSYNHVVWGLETQLCSHIVESQLRFVRLLE